jgi:hypothetical protein
MWIRFWRRHHSLVHVRLSTLNIPLRRVDLCIRPRSRVQLFQINPECRGFIVVVSGEVTNDNVSARACSKHNEFECTLNLWDTNLLESIPEDCLPDICAIRVRVRPNVDGPKKRTQASIRSCASHRYSYRRSGRTRPENAATSAGRMYGTAGGVGKERRRKGGNLLCPNYNTASQSRTSWYQRTTLESPPSRYSSMVSLSVHWEHRS